MRKLLFVVFYHKPVNHFCEGHRRDNAPSRRFQRCSDIVRFVAAWVLISLYAKQLHWIGWFCRFMESLLRRWLGHRVKIEISTRTTISRGIFICGLRFFWKRRPLNTEPVRGRYLLSQESCWIFPISVFWINLKIPKIHQCSYCTIIQYFASISHSNLFRFI